MALADRTKEVLTVAMADAPSGTEIAAAIDSSTAASAINTAKTTTSSFVIAGLLIATNTDNTDAATLGFLVGDTVALIKDADQTLQTIATDNEFAVAPAVGDLIVHYKSV
jgi:hypothetical protein